MKSFYIFVFTILVFCISANGQNRVPIADAGHSRYVSDSTITLDGSDSYDPDNNTILSFKWQQIKGISINISNENTANPVISKFNPNSELKICEFKLVVNDGELESSDTVLIYIVPAFNSANPRLSLQNPPFNPDKPTIIAFGGGDCSCGVPLYAKQPSQWYDQANYITGSYCPPYSNLANELIVYLSENAPEYSKDIQTIGFSTGGNPAMIIANYLNSIYKDARYAVNRVSLLDAPCIDFPSEVINFHNTSIAGEKFWVDTYRVSADFIPGAVNIFFPDGEHSTPYSWFKNSASPENWKDNDIYNSGVTAGYYFSVIGPGKNFHPVTNITNYYFQWTSSQPDLLEMYNEESYTGKTLKPATLIGPDNETVVEAEGTLLTCEKTTNSISYHLIFGSEPEKMETIISKTDKPPAEVIKDFPFNPTYWTIKTFDTFGSSTYSDPKYFYTSLPSIKPVVSFINPPNGSTIKKTIDVEIKADSSEGIRKVKLYINNSLEQTIYASPWIFKLDTLPLSNKTHTLSAVAYSNVGDKTKTNSIINIDNMKLILNAERKSIDTWLTITQIGEIKITIDNAEDLVQIKKYILYKKIKYTSSFLPLKEFVPSEIKNGIIKHIDTNIDKKSKYIYIVTALNTNDIEMATSNQSEL